LAFAAFMPQFIMFSLYISNDTLTALIGVLLTLQFYFFIKNPDKYRLLVLAVLLGAGLSTKLSMAYFIPSIVLLIVFVKFRQGLPLRKIVLVLVIFFITASLLGSYKLAQNYTTVGDPFYVPELMLSSFEGTQKIVPGLNNLLNINVIDLVKFPLISDASKNSFFLMMYGTFWFQHIPESNFNAANIPGYGTNELDSSLTGRMLFLVAIIPTIIMILGFLVIVHLSRKLLSDKKLKKEEFDNLLFKLVTVLLLPVCLLMFLFMGLKYDVWSLFQGRYLFLAMFGILIIISEGIELFKKYKFISKVIWVLFFSLLVLFLYYFLTNILAFLV
ncbi:MAG: hypothetical protein NTY48_06545, partial [Candidatus Diapherotrites archaeon]|nr:hypothetical protein [Candidatus Diapherotrites archaeon]